MKPKPQPQLEDTGLFTLFQELGLLVLIHFLFGLFVFFYWHCSTLRSADGTFSNFPQYLDDKNISLFQDFWKNRYFKKNVVTFFQFFTISQRQKRVFCFLDLLKKNIFSEGCVHNLYLSTEPQLCIWTSYFWTNINDSWNPIETATKCPFAISLNLKCPMTLMSKMPGEW